MLLRRSTESVYDLLPKELQLQPTSAQTDTAATSQKSGGGGEAGPPPSEALASAAPTSALEHLKGPQHLHPPSGGDGTGADVFGAEGAQGCGTGGASTTVAAAGEPGAGLVVQPHQNTPSKRRPVLSISPPPEDLLDDSQMSCQEEVGTVGPGGPDSEHSSSMWADDSASNFSLVSSSSYNDNTEVPRKSRKRTPRQRPGHKPALPEDSMDVFDADSAKAPHFVLSQLGSDKAGPKASSLETVALVKGGLLTGQYPPKIDGKELKIVVQPETQHRARYLTEGSRGSVKDRTQQSFPQVKLEGVNEPVLLQVFVANDTGRVKPHGFYQACRVTGRNTTACKEVEIEGTTVIEIPLEPSGDMSLAVDCVGILKLRNADVEARIGVAGSKKKSTRARLAFRVNIPQPDGSLLTLQTTSSPILCTQPAGVPEILKKSLHSCSVKGGQEVFIIGKNFLKGTKVIFQENIADDTSWQAEAKIDMDLFHQNHLVVMAPPYHTLSISSPVTVGIFIVTNAGRSHDAQTFTYTPDSVDNTNLLAVSTETLVSVQKNLELSSSAHPSVESFPSPMPRQLEDVELPQALPVFASLEPLGNIQKQDISPTTSYPVSGDTTIPPIPQEVPQQFLRDPQESISPEAPTAGHGVVVMALPQMPAPSQPQTQQTSIFPQEGVARMERAVMELHAENTTTLQQVFEAAVAQQQLNSVLYSPPPSAESLQRAQQHAVPSPQAPQSVSLLQQPGELLTIQTSFQQQTPAHTSPPQQLFQSPSPVSETQSPQRQVQATLLPNTLTVLTSVSLNLEHESTGPTLFLSPSPQPPQQQQTGLAFLSSMETSASEPQSVSLFQNQQQTQLSTMQQQSMPMEQQQTPPQQPPIPVGQQGSMFQSLPSQANPLPQSQLAQPQATGRLLCTTDLSPQAIPPALLFSTQSPDSSALDSIGVSVGMPQQDVAEPMSFQDQSSLSVNSSSSNPRQQSLFQEQQPMQVTPCSSGVPSSQPVERFLPQTSLSNLQNSMDTQELSTQATASGTTIFVVQAGVGVVATPGQQPADQFFQASGNAPVQGQPKVFVFGIQNDPPQLLSSSGPSMASQSQPQNLQPLLDTPMAQTSSSMQASMHGGLGTLQGQIQSGLGSAMQTDLQNAMQTGTQSALQSSLQALETSLPTPMQTSLETQLQGGLHNTLPASANVENLLESLQKQ
ncbi:hypothetical protein NHX12_002611 [Muraenolepis orangiensis]|uniref:Nuclear factor of activated T-cells 5 n=1 Tax=Muraenolepis orangiensis TaxID=630683 RepID=A0A9Q0ID74_9TELE|nr:hypothetical protein NHX12_002611 [Muraenolepis orangiensis]